MTTSDSHYEELLLSQYRDKVGVREDSNYPKSHWPECDYGNIESPRRIVMPGTTPARLISCNACLRRRNYIRLVHCDPRVDGWPYDNRTCGLCETGNDCETWLRVRDAGADVETVLHTLDPDADHPVTWIETGLVLGQDADSVPLFNSKEDLDRYCDALLKRYPAECGYLTRLGSDQDVYAYYLEQQRRT